MPESKPKSVGIVLLAAGRGERLGGEIPKQYRPLAGRPLLAHSLERLAKLPGVREIVLVVPDEAPPADVQTLIDAIDVAHPSVTFKTTRGGARRQDSVAEGLAALAETETGDGDVALVHDSARPFPPSKETLDLIESAHATGGAILALPATDTVKQSDNRGRIEATLDRERIWLAQTPQAFRAEHLPGLIETLRGERDFTDEAAALEAMGVAVALVVGSPSNFKVTSPEDLRRAERELESK